MSAPDPTTVGLTLQATGEVAKQLQDFTAAVLGQPNKTVGTILGEWVNQRWKNIKAVTDKADLIILDIGFTPQLVALNVVQPIMEAASLQDSPDIQQIYANLLANAADPRNTTPMPQIFVTILKDFGSTEVRFLDSLLDAANERLKVEIQFSHPSQIRFSVDRLMVMYSELGFPIVDLVSSEFWIMLAVLQRGNVVDDIVEIPDLIGAGEGANKLERTYHLTDLGSAFVLACRPPKKTFVI
jgi:hypothetical protein